MEGDATHIRRRRKALRILAALLLAFAVCFGAASGAIAAGSPETARPSVNGRLHVEGTQLVDAAGKAVQLRGVSTHGLTWFPDFLNESLFGQLSADWNCSLIRLAMYSEQYCGPEGEESLALMRKGIDLAIRSDLYVLVDWHILKDGDPNENREAAAAFFDRIAAEYADCPNLIFEICNEPNGGTDWGMVKAYSETIIPVIRKHIPDAVILIGTPEFDRNLGDPLLRPLEYDNVMYVLHFYAASHREGLLAELRTAVEAGGRIYEGITTLMTEHNLRVYLDEGQDLSLGEPVELTLAAEAAAVTAKGVVTGIGESRNRRVRTHTIEILDFCGKEREYWQILYDRVPTLPQSLHRDFGFLRHLWQNAAHRIARSVRR